MIDIILFIIMAFIAVYSLSYMMSYAGWYPGYQMFLNGIAVIFMAYFVFGEFPHVYQIVAGQFLINPITLSMSKVIAKSAKGK